MKDKNKAELLGFECSLTDWNDKKNEYTGTSTISLQMKELAPRIRLLFVAIKTIWTGEFTITYITKHKGIFEKGEMNE